MCYFILIGAQLNITFSPCDRFSCFSHSLTHSCLAHAPTNNLPPRVAARSSISGYEAEPQHKSAISPIKYPGQGTASTGSTRLTRPQSTSSLPSQTKSVAISPVKASKASLARYPGPPVQNKASTMTSKSKLIKHTYMYVYGICVRIGVHVSTLVERIQWSRRH